MQSTFKQHVVEGHSGMHVFNFEAGQYVQLTLCGSDRKKKE